MVLALLVVAVSGCDRTDLFVYSCQQPDEDHKDANGEPDPCHRNDPTASDAGSSEDAGGTCDGVCLPHIPLGWGAPALVWMGAEADAPLCSAIVGDPGEHFTGHADLDAPILCGACTCDPPSGSCALPATLTASSTICPGNGSGVTHTSFDPPASWGGTCTPANAISAGKLCNGVPCVQSVTIAPLTLSQSGCLPIEPVNVQPPPTWKTFARACVRDKFSGNCAKENEVCVPPSSRADFKVCALKEGDPTKLECPAGYPDRSVFYQSFLDVRSCSPCTCGAPIGSTCTGSISIFNNDACSNVPLVVSAAIDAIGSQCLDVKPVGAGLLSKSASAPVFTSGTCVAEGGEPKQKALPDIATVICCLGTP
jgi:hypothetical protein